MLKKLNKRNYAYKFTKTHRFALFLIGFSIMGGVILLLKSSAAPTFITSTQHKAQCTVHSPSKTFVRPGESFAVTVHMKNVGNNNSTWSPEYAFFLSEYSTNITSGVSIWNASGGTFTGSVPIGSTKIFNLTAKAPGTPGVYGMRWGMHIVYQGFFYDLCPNINITVKNPPVVSLTVNGQPSNINLTQGAGLTLSWSASNGPTSCSASGNWSGSKTPPSGNTENRTGDTASTGTKTYYLQCSNQVGASTKVSRTVIVNAAPPPAPNPTPTNPSSNPTPTSSPGSSSSSPKTTVPVVKVDTSSPSTPTNFKAVFQDTLVNLTWDPSNDDFGVSGYILERSTDQTQWQQLGEKIDGQNFTDKDIKFQTNYFYRLHAVDDSGNVSANTATQITTGSFVANTNAEDNLELTSVDGTIKVTIPNGALSQDASCDLAESNYLHPGVQDYVSVTGPYELLCKLESGEKVTVFNQPIKVELILTEAQKKQYPSLKFYTHANEWEEINDVAADNSFVLGDSTDFAIMGKIKKTPIWQKLLLILIILAAIIGGGLFGLLQIYRYRLRKEIERQNQDNYNKERGY